VVGRLCHRHANVSMSKGIRRSTGAFELIDGSYGYNRSLCLVFKTMYGLCEDTCCTCVDGILYQSCGPSIGLLEMLSPHKLWQLVTYLL
jgi:hypothetical protein